MGNFAIRILKAFIVVCMIMTATAHAQEVLPVYELSVSFEPEENLLRGEARIALPSEGSWDVDTAGLNVLSAELDGAGLEPESINQDRGVSVSGGGVFRIAYEVVLKGAEADIQNVGVVGSVVSPEGISLTGGWYPGVKGLALYGLTAVVPEGFAAVSEADSITERETPEGLEYKFHFLHPAEGLTLAAGRYAVSSDTIGDTEVHAYFFEEDAALAGNYIEYAKRYISMYEEMLGPYPYRRFSVVENFLPTGYSMPTYTLLGRDVVRLPFIVETSLGHEVLHQWFGNSVYGDPGGGNWTEGLTTYLADHLYKEREGEGSDYRKRALVDYQSYVASEKAVPLRSFQGRVDPATKSVGYGKGAMLFHMLRERVGEETFFGTLKRFYERNKFRAASWADIRESFEVEAGEDLEEFFVQWLDRDDLPRLEILKARVLYLKGVPHVLFDLEQKTEKPYKLLVKARITTDKGEQEETLEIEEEKKSFKIAAGGTPRELALDEGYDLMRSLWPGEFPPVVSRLVGDEKRLLVVPDDGVDTYLELTRTLKGEGFTVEYEEEVKDKDIMTSSVLLLGTDGPVHRRLFGAPVAFNESGGFALKVMRNPLNPDKVVAVAYAGDREEVDAVARKIFRYGRYSYLRFEGGTNVEKETAESDTGMRVRLSHGVSGVRPRSALDLDDIIRDVIDRAVIYVGESHTTYEDHRVQLEVIRALHERGRKFAVGMEIFQRPFQKALDEYIAGEITEKEFLKASEYFKRWRFDYNLYREIVDFAKANGIPVVALNTDSDIVRKVSQGGLDALSEEERGEIPPDMDMTDEAYRRRLMEVFKMHRNAGRKDFENFYQSQILWDETMAHSVAGFLKENPGHQMVVLAGVGHVAWGSGIPKRAQRLTGKDYAILVNANVETIEEGVADYVLFPEPLEPPKAPVLGVMLVKADRGVKVEEVKPHSAAEAAGLKKGDIIVSADGIEVGEVADIKVALFDHDEGDKIDVKVLRRRFLAGRKEMELSVTLR